MACYSSEYPVAFHIVPLHLLKGVFAYGALLAKSSARAGRPTTEQIDSALGFHGFVHFYMLSAASRIPEMPILRAQLSPSAAPPFPHAALELSTHQLMDEESLICNWNLAVSRPASPRFKGGNWTRGTKASRVVEGWSAFRSTNPTLLKARGFFSGDYLVPTLTGDQIALNLRCLRSAPGRIPELLLRSPVQVTRCSRLLVFSRLDYETVSQLRDLSLPLVEEDFPGYRPELVQRGLRSAIAAYYAASASTEPPDFAFDAIRPRTGLRRPRTK